MPNTKTQTKILLILIAYLFSLFAIIHYSKMPEYTMADIHVKRQVESENIILTGKASFYDYILDSGWSSRGHFVCATRDFERYSFVRATNLDNGKSVVCKVTDFGPNETIYPERIIDLSSTSFAQIADLSIGVVNVSVEQL